MRRSTFRALEVRMAMVRSLVAVLRSLDRSLDRLVDSTPSDRDRTVDGLRAFSILVVVLWHWALSVTHCADGRIVMPNPIDQVPGSWVATWLLQVMPVFFLVGGFANLAAWEQAGRDPRAFLRRRADRLLRPTALFVAVWVVVEPALLVSVPGYTGVLEYGLVVFVPLWFLASYLWVALLVPLTAAAHRRAAWATLGLLSAAVVAVDVVRFLAEVPAFGLVNTALVWVFVHHLGYLWRDGTLDAPFRHRAVVIAGLAALIVVASLEVYPSSMVATGEDGRSHMFPTTAGIAALATFQLGVVLMLRPAFDAWLRRRRVWKAVVALNAVILTIFLWHMTALLVTFTLAAAAGLPILPAPTAAWWAQRPVWLLGPAVVLAVLVAVFARAETAARTRPASANH